MGHMKVDATGEHIVVAENEETGAVDMTIGTLTDPVPMKPSEVRSLATILLAEVQEPIIGATTSAGVRAIGAERLRQITREGYAPEQDAIMHEHGELLSAAIAYLMAAARRQAGLPIEENDWPWEDSAFKPKTYVEDLTRAGALIAAEIDRVTRA